MKTYEITNSELLEYLRNELENEKRKEIAARIYEDKELRDRFQAIQRIEALVRENYQYPDVKISLDIERKISAYISQMVEIILAEKANNEQNIKTLKDQQRKAQEKKVKIIRIVKSISWAASIIIIFSFFISLINSEADNSTSKHRGTTTNISVSSEFKNLKIDDIPLIRYPIQDFVNFDVFDKEASDKKEIFDTSERDVVSKITSYKGINISIEKFEKADFIKKFRGNTEVIIVRRSGLKGDINGDGVVDARDIALLEDMILNNAGYFQEADYDGDNKITIRDLNLLRRLVMLQSKEQND